VKKWRLAPVLLIAAALAGCGGDSDGGGGDENSEQGGASFEAGYQYCAGGLEATADALFIPPEEATREDILTRVGEQISGGDPADAEQAQAGCEKALDEAEGGGASTGTATN
jgi:hypothetical protein